MSKLKNSKDLIVLLLYAPGITGEHNEPISGQTRLMKMVFLFNEEIRPLFNKNATLDEDLIPDFEPYDYGPFSPKVYSDLEWLVNMEFIDVIASGSGELPEAERREIDYWTATGPVDETIAISRVGKSFALSRRGVQFVERMKPKWQLSEDQWKILETFKKKCVHVPLHALLRYVYTKYPNMTTASKIKDEVLE